jgi:hypothetical protein
VSAIAGVSLVFCRAATRVIGSAAQKCRKRKDFPKSTCADLLYSDTKKGVDH